MGNVSRFLSGQVYVQPPLVTDAAKAVHSVRLSPDAEHLLF